LMSRRSYKIAILGRENLRRNRRGSMRCFTFRSECSTKKSVDHLAENGPARRRNSGERDARSARKGAAFRSTRTAHTRRCSRSLFTETATKIRRPRKMPLSALRETLSREERDWWPSNNSKTSQREGF